MLATILDKPVEKIVYLDSIFLNIVAVPVLPSPPSPESNVVVYSKESLIPGRLWEATLNWGKGFSFRKGVVLEIVLLRRKVDMMGKLSQVVLSGIVDLNDILCNLEKCIDDETHTMVKTLQRIPLEVSKSLKSVRHFL